MMFRPEAYQIQLRVNMGSDPTINVADLSPYWEPQLQNPEEMLRRLLLLLLTTLQFSAHTLSPLVEVDTPNIKFNGMERLCQYTIGSAGNCNNLGDTGKNLEEIYSRTSFCKARKDDVGRIGNPGIPDQQQPHPDYSSCFTLLQPTKIINIDPKEGQLSGTTQLPAKVE